MKRAPRVVLTALALGGLLLGAATLRAEEGHNKDKPQDKKPKLMGVVKSIDAEHSTFVLTVKGKDKDSPDTDVTITVNDKTVYKLDGKDVAMGDVVKVGNRVMVTHEGNVASEVQYKTPKPAKPAE